MSLISLPKELLLMIISHLPLPTIERLALTFNKQITPIVLPSLRPLFTYRHQAKLLTQRFGSLCIDFCIESSFLETHRAKFGIPDGVTLHKPSASERLQRLGYLDLNGDLSWLKPLDPHTARETEAFQHFTALSRMDMNALVDRARSVGITLPPAFVKLFSNQALMERVPSASGSLLRIEGGLRKVPAVIDGGAGGYTVSIYADQQGCYYWSLYVTPGPDGLSCVLGSAWDTGTDWEDIDLERDTEFYSATKEEMASNETMAVMQENDVALEGFEFEVWLALVYFEQWIWCCYDDEDGVPGEGLLEYIWKMYVENWDS